MKKELRKKGAIAELQPLVIALIGVGIVLVVGFLIIAQIRGDLETRTPCPNTSNTYNTTTGQCCLSATNCTVPYGQSHAVNGTLETMSALSDVPTWLPIIVITIIGGLLISLVVMFRR